MAEIYWLRQDLPGKLGIAARPRGGDWLKDEMRSWQSAGVKLGVSLLQDSEVRELGLEGEAAACSSVGLDFLAFPVPDLGVPKTDEALALVHRLHLDLIKGRGVAIHCRMGIGRSSVVAAALLIHEGRSADEAFDAISASRGLAVPDTQEQRRWVEEFAPKLGSKP